MVTRNSEATQAKILAAATQAFVASGPAGARVDAIAATAGVNKRMLYHHFGDKQGLYQAVLDALDTHATPMSRERARLLAWEGLSASSDALLASSGEVEGSVGASIEPLLEPTAQSGLDAQMLALLRTALQVFPHVCGPEVERLTGLAPGSDAFGAALARLQDRVERLVDTQVRVQVPKAKVTLRARSTPRNNAS